jgi:hypothetical protein
LLLLEPFFDGELEPLGDVLDPAAAPRELVPLAPDGEDGLL